MIRTIFYIGIAAIVGLFALKLLFGILGVAFGLFGFLLVMAVKIALVGGAIYLVLHLVAPETARRLRGKYD
jgi:hypothetical protein